MADTVIISENIGKKYILSHKKQNGPITLRDTLSGALRNIFESSRTENMPTGCTTEEFWALKDICFEIKRGEKVGIIGKNGAGKSTLLKILSRITEPTSGRISITGRVASLLEVGTGFHPELTGRENIFLNGAILGMSRLEIKKKFDEIVAFAEVDKFLDTPVKRYSSGMYVRLAFAVAAHLEPEILIIDEVLAVGDIAFQQRCLGKIDAIGKEGRTVLFVSHNMQAIQQLCQRSLLLNSGSLIAENNSEDVIDLYMQQGSTEASKYSLREIIQRLPKDDAFELENISILQNNQQVNDIVQSGASIDVSVTYRVFRKTTGLRVFIDLCDDQELLLFRSFHDEDCSVVPVTEPGRYTSKASIPAHLLAPLKYDLRIQCGIHNVRFCIPPPGVRIPIKVELSGKYNRAYAGDPCRGRLAPVLDWETTPAHV
jgi:lipopolysaccharide transport system ATP-binding protein